MDYTSLAGDMEALGLFMEIVCAIVGVALAIGLGALLAWRLSPFDPSEAESVKSYENHVDFHVRWASVRARRQALCQVASSDVETRRTDRSKVEADQTIPDMRLAEMFSAEDVPVRPVIRTRIGFAS